MVVSIEWKIEIKDSLGHTCLFKHNWVYGNGFASESISSWLDEQMHHDHYKFVNLK